jgi:hypothetical protein
VSSPNLTEQKNVKNKEGSKQNHMTIRDSEIQIFKSRKLSFEEDTEEKLNNYAQ